MARLLQPIPLPFHPFEPLGIDLLGQFAPSTLGNRWVVVAIYHLAHYVFTDALLSGSPAEIAHFFIHHILLKNGASRCYSVTVDDHVWLSYFEIYCQPALQSTNLHLPTTGRRTVSRKGLIKHPPACRLFMCLQRKLIGVHFYSISRLPITPRFKPQ